MHQSKCNTVDKITHQDDLKFANHLKVVFGGDIFCRNGNNILSSNQGAHSAHRTETATLMLHCDQRVSRASKYDALKPKIHDKFLFFVTIFHEICQFATLRRAKCQASLGESVAGCVALVAGHARQTPLRRLNGAERVTLATEIGGAAWFLGILSSYAATRMEESAIGVRASTHKLAHQMRDATSLERRAFNLAHIQRA